MVNKEKKLNEIQVQIPETGKWININQFNCDRNYKDPIVGTNLMIIVDEAAELLTEEKGTDQATKTTNAQKQEIRANLGSIAALGRSSGIILAMATQRNDAKIFGGSFLNNLQERIVCGKLKNVESMMALGTTYANTLNSHPGSGIVAPFMTPTKVQHYFDPGGENGYLHRWYKDRGLDENGYMPDESKESNNKDVTIDTSNVEVKDKEKTVEFAGTKTVINEQAPQQWSD